ncbi:MAG: mercury resistance system transport protein MerF [Hyphomonas sp.]|nr:mercury resistance system transport protein MerF [Hyphomonas sp.]
MKNKLVATGVIGAAIAAVCCFTPFLAIALPAVGLGGLLAYVYNDAVLLPVLAIFLAIAGYGLWKGRAA